MKLISKPNYIHKLKYGGPSGAEIFLVMAPDFLNNTYSTDSKEYNGILETYEKQYKGNPDFRKIYNDKLNKNSNLTNKPQITSNSNKINFDLEIDTIGKFIYDTKYGEGFWNRLMKSAPENATEEEKKKRNKEIAKLRKETKNIFKRKGKLFKEDYLKWRNENFRSHELSNTQYTHPSFSHNPYTEPTDNEYKDKYELSLQGLNVLNPDLELQITQLLKINLEISNLNERELNPNSEEYKKYHQNYVDRMGELGYDLLRFVDPTKVNFNKDKYLNKSMMSHVGNKGDTSIYKNNIKHRNSTKYNSIILLANKYYGTNFESREDVAAFLQSLKNHGFDILIDGIIGPETEAYLAFFFGLEKDNNSNGITFKNKQRLYSGKTNEQVFNNTLNKLKLKYSLNLNTTTNADGTPFIPSQIYSIRGSINDNYNPISTNYNFEYGNWLNRYLFNGPGSFDEMLEMTGNKEPEYYKQGGLIPKPNYLIKLKKDKILNQ